MNVSASIKIKIAKVGMAVQKKYTNKGSTTDKERSYTKFFIETPLLENV